MIKRIAQHLTFFDVLLLNLLLLAILFYPVLP